MAININRVYQTVLALANKEQRGYITPQEFNLFAQQAQMSIFEQYFYDLDQFKRLRGNEVDHLDNAENLEKKIDNFAYSTAINGSASTISSYGSAYPIHSYDLPSDLYRIGDVRGGTGQGLIEKVSFKKFNQAMAAYLTRPTSKRPIYYIKGTRIYVAPAVENASIQYIRKPSIPKWTYIVVNEKPIWNGGAFDRQDFEIDPSDENKLVLKILQLAGVAIEDFNLVQAAGTAEVNTVAQQKQ